MAANSLSIRRRSWGAALLVMSWAAGCGDNSPDLRGPTAALDDAGLESRSQGPQTLFVDSWPPESGARDSAAAGEPVDAGQPADSLPEPDAAVSETPDAAVSETPDAAVSETPDAGQELPPDAAQTTPSTMRIAAVQYGSGAHDQLPDCRNDICAIEALVREAAAAGARIIVTPEYAIYKRTAENSPELGALPAQDRRWLASTIMHQLAELADELDVLLVFDLLTKADGNVYNTAVAVDALGRVVARHYKFQLYGDFEEGTLTAGTSFEYSHLETEVGTIGLLVCADVHCVYGSSTECSLAQRRVFDEYTAIETDVVLFLGMWQAGESSGAATRWWPLNIQQAYAETQEVWFVAANTTVGDGRGGGIFAPGGTPVVTTTTDKPTILYADIARQ